jgi:bacteriocin-like protein
MKTLSISELNQISGSKAGKYFKDGLPTAEGIKKLSTKAIEVYLGDLIAKFLGVSNSKVAAVAVAIIAEDCIDSFDNK